MFTAQKSKLFFNDPKFVQIKQWNADAQQSAVNKIFGGQRQVRRSKVSYNVIQNNERSQSNPYILLDFLQSRMGAFQDRLVHNVEELFSEKERIKQKYNQAQDLYSKANRKLKKLMSNIHTQVLDLNDIQDVEVQVNQIQRLYEENQFLRSMNQQIKLRIQKKQSQVGSFRK